MCITNRTKFKGEIENYLRNGHSSFDSKIDQIFSCLKVKTWLSRTNIIKKDGYHASHLLFVLFMLPIFKINSVHGFCKKHWHHWSISKKDTFYRFKHNAYRWRTFMYKLMSQISKAIAFEKGSIKERYFIVDDSVIAKRGKHIENVSFHYDHSIGKTVLGYCIVTLGMFTGKGFYPIDFAYNFGQKRHSDSPDENIGDPRSISGQRSFEAKHYSKLDLALMMIERAINNGFTARYVLFDSWYAWPAVIKKVRAIKDDLHVICRLKENPSKYHYQGKRYRLSELYQKVKSQLKKDHKTGLLLKRVTVKLPDCDEESVIVFAKGYREPKKDNLKGKKKTKESKWVAFLSTDNRLHASSIIKKYIKRWPVEVCFKECKQLLGLGKEQSNSFNAQVFSTTASFMRYSLISYLNETERHSTLGSLFETLVDDTAVTTYAQRLWDFFQGLFKTSFSKIFDLFNIKDDFQPYLESLTQALKASTPIIGCET